MNETVIKNARAFNLGSDARLAGQPIDANPYSRAESYWKRWREGWQDVNLHWCAWVRHGFRRELPEVRLYA